MKIKSLQKVVSVHENQRVIIFDQRNHRTIETVEGWVLEPSYDYDGYNYEEIERILNLSVSDVEFNGNTLKIWAY